MSISDKLIQLNTTKQNIKQAIIDKGVDMSSVPFTNYHTKIAEIVGEGGGGTEPTPKPDGAYTVRFFDYDGTILKTEYVLPNGSATAPILPDYSVASKYRPALNFQEWNNDFSNITSDLDIGATYIPTDDKTHVFVRLTVVSGKDLSLYLNKTDTSTLSIDWGDNITTTHTNNGNFNTSHTYSDYGDYEIKIWISSGSGEYGFGNGDIYSIFVGGSLQIQRDMLMYLFIGNNVSSIGAYAFSGCYSLTSINIPVDVSSIPDYAFGFCYSLTSINIPANVSNIGSNAFSGCYSILKYVFNRALPPSLADINAFSTINSICKIYVPDASVTAYKNATNWITYADYIYPISEMEGDN